MSEGTGGDGSCGGSVHGDSDNDAGNGDDGGAVMVTVLALSMEVVAKTVQLHEISHDICGLFLTK